MVLESLSSPEYAEKHSLLVFLIGFLYASIGLFLSYWVFKDQASIVMVLFVVLAAVPLFYNTMKYEEKQAREIQDEKSLLFEHARVLRFCVFFFLGLTIAFGIWYIVLPAGIGSKVFEVQAQTILNLNQQITGQIAQLALFARIFLNNLKVLIFSLLFSFVFGSGAIFILTWNASVIGTAIGNFVKVYTATVAAGGTGVYFVAFGLSLLRYFIHGIPEVIAYFVAGLAGGILSVAIIRGDLRKYFNKILLDFSDLVIISILFLIIAGLLEVFVTPIFFSTF